MKKFLKSMAIIEITKYEERRKRPKTSQHVIGMLVGKTNA